MGCCCVRLGGSAASSSSSPDAPRQQVADLTGLLRERDAELAGVGRPLDLDQIKRRVPSTEGDDMASSKKGTAERRGTCANHRVPIVVGLGGNQVMVNITDDCDLSDVKQELRSQAAIGDEGLLDIVFSSADGVVDSVGTLLKMRRDDKVIFATLRKSVNALSWEELREELTLDSAEFKGHVFVLSKLPAGSTPRAVADYLWQHQVLITSVQAQQLFDLLLPKLRANPAARADSATGNLRAQLIIALHSFCVDPHHIWEPNDGMSECLWANMSFTSASPAAWQSRRILTRGALINIQASAPSSDPGPASDASHMREVARAKREQQETPLEAAAFPEFYGGSWRGL